MRLVNIPKTVFVRFSDEAEFTTPIADYQNMFNNNTTNYNSMYNYFQAVSYNQLAVYSYFYPTTLTPIVVSYQDAFTRVSYQPYNVVTNPIGYTDANRTDREQTLIMNATNAISAQVPANINVDEDNDGFVDNMCFVIKGAPGEWNTILCPHQWELYSKTAYIHGSRLLPYVVQIQDILDVGVLCHETLHSVGFTDLYHYNFDGLDPVYEWDIMDVTLNPPQHTCAYMKYRYGTWISSIPQITTNGRYTLNLLTSSTNNAYMIRSSLFNTQYFVVEYRSKNSTFEDSLPGPGLLVYRINSAKDGQGNAFGPPDEVYM